MIFVTLYGFPEPPRCEAFVDDRRWNGFLCPVLTLAGVETLAAAMGASGNYKVTLDDTALTVLCADDTEERFPIETHACLGGERGVAFGGGWCWEEWEALNTDEG